MVLFSFLLDWNPQAAISGETVLPPEASSFLTALSGKPPPCCCLCGVLAGSCWTTGTALAPASVPPDPHPYTAARAKAQLH